MTSSSLVRLDLRPGDLQMFKGRYTMHRLTPVRGVTSRYTAILSYARHPDVVAKVERARQL